MRGGAPASALQPAWRFALPASTNATCTAVVAAYDTSESQLRSLQARLPAQCSMILYDKGPGDARCATVVSVPCVTMPNDGADWNPVWLRHVLEHYDHLADYLIFVPSRFAKHNRLHTLADHCGVSRFGTRADDFCCLPRTHRYRHPEQPMKPRRLGDMGNFTMRGYLGRAVKRARVRPFGAWLEAHLGWGIGDRRLRTAEMCSLSTFATSATNVRAHPRAVYASLAAQFAGGAALAEDAFFVEWAESAIFGAAWLQNKALGQPARGHVAQGQVERRSA